MTTGIMLLDDSRAPGTTAPTILVRLVFATVFIPEPTVHPLFKHGEATDGITYAAVGSPVAKRVPTWSSGITRRQVHTSSMDSGIERRDRSQSHPVATDVTDQNPVYPTGLRRPNSPEICSSTYKCRIDGDIWDVVDGHVGISFDDGPTDASDDLLAFLKENDQQVTHFLIGSNMIYNPQQFLSAFNQGGDMAVVAELGWTMEIIHNSTGGRVPEFWRPPYGDCDVRIRTIAKEVIQCSPISTEDWSLTTGGKTPEVIKKSMAEWLTWPKSPGLNILEHELSNESVASFIAAYSVMKENNWNLVSLAQLVGNNASYQNAPSSNRPVNLAHVAIPETAASFSASANGAASKTQKVVTSATGSATAPANPSNAASSGWTNGPTGMLAASVICILWT
ncbi:hypothetical protein B0H17DRAFT_1195550 [Mycena rosella]|uniref:chitin deacetylase n=1 Tax=Mycena rosella TaxID=1033263 RepID=A0AAD7DY52_MYCRO|nr:hypothetical protein B0H17DRAFT_1195550 [Mycena rosella]